MKQQWLDIFDECALGKFDAPVYFTVTPQELELYTQKIYALALKEAKDGQQQD